MKYILTILLCLPLIVKSQDTIKVPVPIARQIAKDLTICDSTKAVLDLTKENLKLTENKSMFKDSVIGSYKMKCEMYTRILSNEQKKFNVQKTWTESLKKENKSLKVRLLYTKITMGAGIAFLGYLLIK